VPLISISLALSQALVHIVKPQIQS